MKLGAALLFFLMASGAIAETAQKQQFVWHDFGAAIKEAKATKKMILVDIYTDW